MTTTGCCFFPRFMVSVSIELLFDVLHLARQLSFTTGRLASPQCKAARATPKPKPRKSPKNSDDFVTLQKLHKLAESL